jgi:hypothetical protein
MADPCQHRRIGLCKKNPIQVIAQVAFLHLLSLRMAAEDEELLIVKMAELERLPEDLKGIVAFVSPCSRVGILCT